ncbi:hypothetical protein [Microlunatus ginsengisoli]|uniref:PH domain-containing protein n=1 Tax=Microlunatus ginsengisoli TaxID=363863 RepID=A0ABP7AFS6_9ACTN
MSDRHASDEQDRPWLELLRESLAEVDQVPAHILEAGYAAFSWRTIDAELALLTYDSTAPGALAGARSQQASLRAMTFASASCTIELQLDGDAVLGQLIPADGGGALSLLLRDGTSTAIPYDELGCFTVTPSPGEAFRLQLSGDPAVITDWITV